MQYTISATDARRIMRGDGIQLWKEKKGLAQPEDLSGVLRVQMGVVTEAFNLHWWERNHDKEGLKVALNIKEHAGALPLMINSEDQDITTFAKRREKKSSNGGFFEYVSGKREWQTFTPDGFVFNSENKLVGIIDAKHTRAIGDGNEPYAVVQANYWQFVHQMMVTGLDKVFVSVFYGNDEWRPFTVLRNEDDIATLLGAEMLFMRELEEENPPGFAIEAPADHPIPGVPTRKLSAKDVEQANWGADYIAAAGDFITHYDSDKKLDTAKKALRGFLPEDAVKIEAFGVRVNRTQRGIVITNLKEKVA